MANPKQLAKLKKGVAAWNSWKKRNLDSKVDLRGANLGGAKLNGANLAGAELAQAKLFHTNLTSANLIGANLAGAYLDFAILADANLAGANLNRAKLGGAHLHRANLTDANLIWADLHGAQLIDTNLSRADLSNVTVLYAKIIGANLSETNLAKVDFGTTYLCNLDLSVVKGLDAVKYWFPCSIDIDTLYKSKGKIPESFLRGCGVPQEFIDHNRALVSDAPPIQFYSVFISYSSKDQAFAERLHADLQNKKVRCWFAPEDLKIGDKFRVRIDEVIRVYDKLLLVLSENSVGSDWVEKEVESAMEKERQQKRTMLFPIRLDDAVMKIETGWPADVRRTRHIGDFTNWKGHDAYQKAFDRLMRDLKSDEKNLA
jgi:hypothetical protein